MRKDQALSLCWLALGLLGACERQTGRTATDAGLGQSPAASAELPREPRARLDLFVRENLDAELAYSPTTATWLGVHGYDDRVDDVRVDAQAREAARLRQLLERVRALDEEALDPPRRLDRLLLDRRAQNGLYELIELRPLERNPLVYIDLSESAIEELVADESVALPDRLRAITARLWKLRPLFDEARRNLRGGAPAGTSELLVRKAVELGQEERTFLAETLPKALQLYEPKLMDDFRAADGDATRALDDFVGWLQRDLQPRAKGDLALGPQRLSEKLRLLEQLEVKPEELVLLGERELKDSKKRYDEAVKLLVAGKPGADVSKLIEDDHGKPDELQALAQSTVEGMVAFVKAQHLATLPEPERPKVLDMPPALWGFAQLSVARPLESRPRDATLYIDPVDRSWPDRRKQEHLRTFNRAVMVLAIAHDVIGHFLQAERNRRAPTTMQKVALASSLIEGWPHYVERMLLDEGYGAGDAKLRVVVERSVMLRAARLVAAVKLHALGGKIDDVVKVFTDEALLDEYQARREAERAAADPLVLLDCLGRLEIARLRDDWRAAHPDASLGQFHDALLQHGSVPVAMIRKILLPGDKRSPL